MHIYMWIYIPRGFYITINTVKIFDKNDGSKFDYKSLFLMVIERIV